METLDWGPIPTLAQQLAQAEFAPGFTHARWSRAVIDAKGLWEACASSRREALWPAQILPVARFVELPIFFHRKARRGLLRFIFDLFKGRKKKSSLPAPKPEPPVAGLFDIKETMAHCYTWTGQVSLRALAPHFSPFWRDMPSLLLSISPQGIVWQLAAYTLHRYGPESLNQMTSLLPTSGSGATLGDYLALHLQIERLVMNLPAQLRLRPHSLSERRRMGGLRSEAFISHYLAFSQAQDDRKVAELFKGLHLLIDRSPLTQLIYLDVIHNPLNRPRLNPDFAHLFAPPGTDGNGEDSRPGDDNWRDLWMSLLARSMLGACLSPTQSFESLKTAESRLEAIEKEARNKLVNRSLLDASTRIEEEPLVRDARNKCSSLRKQMQREYLDRLDNLNDSFSHSEFLKLRFLDLFVRQVIIEATPEMRQHWRRLRDQVPRPVPSDLFLWEENNGLCFTTFEDLLFGSVAETERQRAPSPNEHQRVRQALLGIGPIGDWTEVEKADKTIAEQNGLSEQAAGDLLMRFVSNRVMLPFPEERRYAPIYILGYWINSLLSRLPMTEIRDRQTSVVP